MKKFVALMAILCLFLAPVSTGSADEVDREPIIVKGDMNGDGVVTVNPDARLFLAFVASEMANAALGIIATPPPSMMDTADINDDGFVDLHDVDPFVTLVAKSR